MFVGTQEVPADYSCLPAPLYVSTALGSGDAEIAQDGFFSQVLLGWLCRQEGIRPSSCSL